ncbi:DUF167 domain-containing protein [Candidatus Woesearchaeota archaeon]|nr:DUF167 domain-containing protein [Candidatus Woesearchaeota archaeon]
MFPIEVKVKANCSRNKFYSKEGKNFVDLNAKPKNNEANLELVKFLSKEFKTKLRIVKGFKSRVKVLDEL